MNEIYEHKVEVSPELVDRNGHVNNVVYLQWLQDAAVQHARATGCTAAASAVGATWVVRSHHIEYLKPAFAWDTITVLTWVVNVRKVRSLRRYRLVRKGDQAIVAEAETDWVFVDATTGRPQAIPETVKSTLPIFNGEP
jgi:acyl-CoA thioester hydrolase